MTAFLKFEPADRIVINLASNETARTIIHVQNISSQPVAFKVKTTQPKRYLVKPNQGILEAGGSDRIQIQIVPKDRVLLATKPGQAASDRFLVQAVGCEPRLAKLERESEDFLKELAALWGTLDKQAAHQSAKFSVGFSTPYGGGSAEGGMEGGSASGGHVPDATAAFGVERVKELLLARGGAGEGGEEVATMRRKYDDLVSYTISLTAERDRLRTGLESTKKELNKAVIARMASEGKGGRGGGSGGGGGGGGGMLGGVMKEGGKEGGKSVGLVVAMLLVALAFLAGHLVHF